jgi:hypothetical protein
LEQILPGEFLEAQVYYTSQIKQKHSEINRLNLSEPDTKNLMMKELEEMDRLFYSLMKDLKTNPSDERILSAMIEHYQVKLEIMSQIIRQLEKTNQLKSTYKNSMRMRIPYSNCLTSTETLMCRTGKRKRSK